MRRILGAEILSVGGGDFGVVQTIKGLGSSSVGERFLGNAFGVQSIHDYNCMRIEVARIRPVTQGTPV